MSHDPQKAKARKQRYLERKKVAKYGPDSAGKDMRGCHGNHARGDKHHRWNNNRIISEHGYIKVRVWALLAHLEEMPAIAAVLPFTVSYLVGRLRGAVTPLDDAGRQRHRRPAPLGYGPALQVIRSWTITAWALASWATTSSARLASPKRNSVASRESPPA